MSDPAAGTMSGGEPTVHLRPLSLSDILDGAMSLYRQNFALFLGVVAVLAVPEAILNAVLALSESRAPFTMTNTSSPNGSGTNSFHYHPAAIGVSVGSGLLSLLFGVLVTGALARVISERYLGRRSGIAQVYRTVGLGGFVLLILASILTTLAETATVLGLVGLGALAIALLVLAGASTLLFLLLIPLGLVGLVLSASVWTHLLFVPQAVVIDRCGVFGALARSWRLVRGSAWRVFGIGLVIALMILVLGGIVGAVVSLALLRAGPGVSTVVSGLIGIIFQPFQFGALTLLYYDLRVRREGFDIEHLMEQMPEAPRSWG